MSSLTSVLKVAAVAALAAAAMPAPAQRQSLAMLDQLESGRWELRLREPGSTIERICLRDGRRLIQLRHPAQTLRWVSWTWALSTR